MNTIIIELCAEDRARLDKLAELMERQLTAAPETPQEAPKAEPEKTIENEEKEAPAPEAVEAPPWEETTSITLDQIQQKVTLLAAGYGGAKKARVRAIVNKYGARVSDLKEQPEKWAEVWEQLIALEKED